jgi:hypothetical protein
MGGMNYVETDLPDGCTLLEWRAQRARAPRRGRRWLLRRG